MKEASITRRIEFDAGHRIPDHKSKCRNIHGHRYVVEASMLGPISDGTGYSDSGMVMDFGDLKDVMNLRIHDVLDHGMMVAESDEMIITWWPRDLKLTIMPYVPTAENIARWCFEQLHEAGLNLVYKVLVSETPNCWAIYKGEDASVS